MRLDVSLNASGLLATLDGMEQFAKAPRAALVEVAVLRVEQQAAWLRGASWRPLKPVSAARKARRGRSTRPLVGGALERSLTTARAAGSVRRLAKRSVVVGTRNPVAHLHQGGTRNMPARKVVSVTAADRDALRAVFARNLMTATGGPKIRPLVA